MALLEIQCDRNLRNRVSQITQASPPRFYSETGFLTPTRSRIKTKRDRTSQQIPNSAIIVRIA
ncbi:MAG: hypothetical protein ACM65M_23305 [Microcoleus sp.]